MKMMMIPCSLGQTTQRDEENSSHYDTKPEKGVASFCLEPE